MSLREGSWFAGHHLSLRKTLVLMYCFVRKLCYDDAIIESSMSDEEDNDDTEGAAAATRVVKTSSKTISDLYTYCREVCSDAIVHHSRQNGGSKIGGQGMTVEIDESKFGRRKYNRGRVVEGHWVVGGICRETGEIFLEIAESRDAISLEDIIRRNVETQSTIITDCWRGYDQLGRSGDYERLSVNHSQNFVDPLTGAHTQNIENTWWQIKRQLPSTHSRNANSFDLQLLEFMWRRHNKASDDLFAVFLKDAASLYGTF
jgi:transposase-like protein